MSNNLDEIREHAERFRRALEQSDLSKWLPTLENFPRGSCDDASLLLAKYLCEVGFDGFYLVFGEFAEAGYPRPHNWLQREQLIVDITADQFNDVDCRVVVTDDHLWRDRYHLQREDIAGWESFEDQARSDLDSAYQAVRSTMDDIEQKSLDGGQRGE